MEANKEPTNHSKGPQATPRGYASEQYGPHSEDTKQRRCKPTKSLHTTPREAAPAGQQFPCWTSTSASRRGTRITIATRCSGRCAWPHPVGGPAVASKIGDPEFGTFLEMLQTDLGFDSKQLCTFMCDGVASKIGDPELGAFLEMLRSDWGFDTKSLLHVHVRRRGVQDQEP